MSSTINLDGHSYAKKHNFVLMINMVGRSRLQEIRREKRSACHRPISDEDLALEWKMIREAAKLHGMARAAQIFNVDEDHVHTIWVWYCEAARNELARREKENA